MSDSYYSQLEGRFRIPRDRRSTIVRRLEVAVVRVLHMISGSWDWGRGRHRKSWHPGKGMMVGHPAFCDGLMIGGGPWLCYCCNRLRLWLEGRPFRESYRPWMKGVPMFTNYFIVKTARRGSWVWPSVKWVYPENERDVYRIWTRVLEESTVKR